MSCVSGLRVACFVASLTCGCADFAALDAAAVPRLTVQPGEAISTGLGLETSTVVSMANDGTVAVVLTPSRARLLDTDGAVRASDVTVGFSPSSIELGPDESLDVSIRFVLEHPGSSILQLDLRAVPEGHPSTVVVSLPVEVWSDWDGDGADHPLAGGSDCDDTDPSVGPGAVEVWYDGVDQNCDGNDTDADGDGSDYRWDCDDSDPAVFPGAAEVWYDGVDQDCDGNDADFDADGYLAAIVGGPDCDDTDPTVHPSQEDGGQPLIDDDCDGLFDEDDVLEGDVVVNEVMRAPSTGDDTAWFEVANVSSADWNLAGWTVHTDTSSGALRLVGDSPPPLASGGLLVICADASAASAVGVACDAVLDPWPSPVPASDSLELRANGLPIDAIRWTSSWPGGSGRSTALDPEAADHVSNDSGRSWCAGTQTWARGSDLGSPGVENSACP